MERRAGEEERVTKGVENVAPKKIRRRERLILQAASQRLSASLPPSPSSSSLQSSRHTQPGAEWAFTVQLCFLSEKERECQILHARKKRKGTKKNTFPFLPLFFSSPPPLLLHSLSPILSFPHVSALNLIPLSFILLLLSLSLLIQDNAHNKLSLETKKRTRVGAWWTPCRGTPSFLNGGLITYSWWHK